MEGLLASSLGKSKAFLMTCVVGWESWGLLGSLWGRYTSGWDQTWMVRPQSKSAFQTGLPACPKLGSWRPAQGREFQGEKYFLKEKLVNF